MNKKELAIHTREQKDIINSMSLSDVVTRLTGEQPKRISNGNYTLICPIHGKTGKGYNSTIKDDKMISCWSQGCFRGDGVFSFLDKYYLEKEGISDYLERFKKIDNLLGTKLYLPLMGQKKKKEEKKKENLFTKEFLVDKYCLEENIKDELMFELLSNKTSILNAGTGTGKTYFLTHFANFLTTNKMVDKVFFLTPRRSLVEEIAEKYKELNFVSFMGNDDFLPENSNIVATTHKAHRINSGIEMPELFIEEGHSFSLHSQDINYAVIIDECHLLHTSRGIVGDIKEIDRLIENSSYTIFTSANTNHFYKACKETYEIENYISVKRKNRLYNLENLDIMRVDTKKKDFIQYVGNICIKDKKRTLIINNNIKENEMLHEYLSSNKITSVSLNSKNKENNVAYEDIIKNSILSTDITICTSIIDTGINIEQEDIRIIIIAPNGQFDDISIIQGFARVRTTKGNNGILILKDNKEDGKKMLANFEENMAYNREELERLQLLFNSHMFDYYTSESYEEYKTVWNVNKENELYENRKSLFKIDGGELNSNPRMIIDEVMLYEYTRKQTLSANYYNDQYVLEVLGDINAKKIEVKKDFFVGTLNNKEKDNTSFEVILKDILENESVVFALTEYYNKDCKLKDITPLQELLEEDEKSTVNLNKTIKTFIKFKTLENIKIDNVEIVKHILNAYLKEDYKSDINKLKWRLYNNVYSVSKSYYKNEFEGTGDLVYTCIRDAFDGQLRNKRKITEKKMDIAVEEYLKIKGYEVTSEGIGKIKNGKFKKIGSKVYKDTRSFIVESIKNIYQIEEDKIIALKK